MQENFKQKLTNLRNKLTENFVIFNEPERGIEFEFVFCREIAVEEWQKTFSEMDPLGRELMREIVTDALDRSVEERTAFIENLSAPQKGIQVSKNARDLYQKRKFYEQFLININSMSQSNLENAHKAFDEIES